MKEISELQHLCVGTEVSAKYRGAFCEAQIKSIKRNISLRILNHKDGRYYNLLEENVRGFAIKVGATIEAQFPESQEWLPGHIQALKDKSLYTVVFDDGDERTLSRGSLCLKGDRHFATSETLDNLPLTDPENFGTPVLSNKKSRSRRRQSASFNQEEAGEESDASNGVGQSPRSSKSTTPRRESMDADYTSVKEKQAAYLSDEMMGCVVLVEPTDKRKHWYPGLIVNPLCYDGTESADNQYIIRSFKTGKLARVNKSIIKPLNKSTMPVKIDTPWKDIVKDAMEFKTSYTIPETWKMEIDDIITNSESDEDEENKGNKKEQSVDQTNFLECLYKFMDDRGSSINKTPVLGYKDLDLCLLYQLVQGRGGFYSVTGRDWHQIYVDLGIPKVNLAAAHNARNAYQKYLHPYEEYLYSWNNQYKKDQSPKSDSGKNERQRKKKNESLVNIAKKEKRTRHNSSQKPGSRGASRGSSPMSNASTPCDDTPVPRRTSRRRRMSESSSVSGESPASVKQEQSTVVKLVKQTSVTDEKAAKKKKISKSKKFIEGDSDKEEKQSATTLSEIVTRRIRRNSTNSMAKYHVGDKLRVRYGEGKTFKPYQAKVLEVRHGERLEDTRYLVHYAGWNQRHDEWISNVRIMELVEESSNPSPLKITKPARSTGTTPTASPFPGSQAHNSDSNGSKRITAKDNTSTLPQPRTSAASILKKIPELSPNTDVLLKNVRNLLGELASDKAENENATPKTELKKIKKEAVVKQLDEVKEAEDLVEPKPQQVANTNAVKRKTPSPTNSRSRNNSPPTVTPKSQPRRTSTRRSKSPAYLAEYGTFSLKETLSPVPIKEEEIISKVEFPLKTELPAVEKNKLSFGLATLPTDINKNYLPSFTTTTVMPVRQDMPMSVKKMTPEATQGDNTEEDSEENEKELSKDEENTESKEDDKSSTDSADEPMDVDKPSSVTVATTEALLKSNAAEENIENQNDEEVSRILLRGKDDGSSESSNDTQGTSDENAQVPSSSKVLTENTPPHTPERTDDSPDDKNSISDDAKMDNYNGEAVSSSDPHPSSSPDYKPNPDDNNNILIKQEKEETAVKKSVQRKRKRRSSKVRSASARDGDSESEYEQSCSNHSNSNHRSKPRKKRIKKKEIPDVPTMLDKDELARMSQEDRIDVLQKKMEEMRKVYQQLKQEVSNIDRKRKRAKKREKEASEALSNVSSPRNYDSPRKTTVNKSGNSKHSIETGSKESPNKVEL